MVTASSSQYSPSTFSLSLSLISALWSAVRVLPIRFFGHGALSRISQRRRSVLASQKKTAFTRHKDRIAASDRASGEFSSSSQPADRSRKPLSFECAAHILVGASIDGHRNEFSGAAAV